MSRLTHEQIAKHRKAENPSAAFDVLASILGASDEDAVGLPGHQAKAWEDHCLPSENLLFELGCPACRPGAPQAEVQQCLAAIGRLKDASVRDFVKKAADVPAFQRLRAQVCIVETALAQILDSDASAVEKYRSEAAEALEQAGWPFGGRGNAGGSVDQNAVINMGVDRLRGKFGEDNFRSETYILLVSTQSRYHDVAARFVMELVPGPKGGLLPDPLLGSITRIDSGIVKCIETVWAESKDRWPEDRQAVWWIASKRPLVSVDGRSAEASIHAVVRSLLEKTPIDTAVAVSASIERKDNRLVLGHVAGGGRKWRLAGNAACDTLVVHQDTQSEARQQIPEDQHKGLPKVEVVTTFEDAWEHLTGECAILSAYRESVTKEWLSGWSKIIDGDRETPLHEGEEQAEEEKTDKQDEGEEEKDEDQQDL